jgi:phage gp36-like protein
MTILTQPELEARLGADDIARLANRDVAVGEESTAITTALADAEAEILGYVRLVATLPLVDVPEILKRICAVVARYNLWRRELPADHPAYISYKDSVRELQQIASGQIALPIVSGSNTGTNAASTAGFACITSTKVFTDTRLSAMLPSWQL